LRKLLGALAVFVVLGGVAEAATCPPAITIEADPTRPGVFFASYAEKPLHRPSTCTPHNGTVHWLVNHCPNYQSEDCSTYVVTKGRRRQRFVFAPDARPGIHTLTVAPAGVVPPQSATFHYRRFE
jgi:hypothetical protein